jgi:hypothetical protein
MAFCCSAGLAVVTQLMEAELTDKVGPKDRHDPERVATRNGTAPGSVNLGGRSVPTRRPRATKTEGSDVTLDFYALFSDRDLFSQVAVRADARRRSHEAPRSCRKAYRRRVRGSRPGGLEVGHLEALRHRHEGEACGVAQLGPVRGAAVLMIDGTVFH